MLTQDDRDINGYKTMGITCEEFWRSEIEKEHERDVFIMTPLQVQDGLYHCKKCKSAKVISISKQVRSSDEGASVFCKCIQCDFSWRED